MDNINCTKKLSEYIIPDMQDISDEERYYGPVLGVHIIEQIYLRKSIYCIGHAGPYVFDNIFRQ